MIISIVNHSNGQVTDEELQTAIRAINRQINEDFAPYWSLPATLRLEGRSSEEPDKVQVPDMRGDAVLYLWDEVDVEGALGYHFQNFRGVPFGFVFTALAQSLGEPWSVTLSHEALELLGDPQTNLLVMGPHPMEEDRDVFHWYEMATRFKPKPMRSMGWRCPISCSPFTSRGRGKRTSSELETIS